MAKSLAPIPVDGSAPVGAGLIVNASGAPSANTTLMPKGHSKSVDPAHQPVGKREYAPAERGGAAYGVSVGFEAHTAPEAGFTQANGRLLAPAVNRTAPNFSVGSQDAN
jgi:hypothetical protein